MRPAGCGRPDKRPACPRLFVMAACLALASSMSPATARATERFVPFDPGRVDAIGAELRETLGLWPDRYPGFVNARLLQSADSALVLQVEFAGDGRALQDRQPLTTAEAAELRRQVTAWMRARAGQPIREGSGRLPFVLGTTAIGLGFYSWAVPVAADLRDKEAVATGMLAAAGAFAIPLLVARASPTTAAAADLALYGASRGIAHGILGQEWDGTRHDASRGRLTWGVVSSVVEGAAGYAWASSQRLSIGQARLTGVGGDLGALWGYAAGAAFGVHGAPGNQGGKGIHGAVLSGSILGIGGGAARAAAWNPGTGDAEIVRASSLIGSGLLASLVDAGTDNEATIWGWLLAGGVAGAVAGETLARAERLSPGQAAMVDLSAVAGAAFGIGATYLLAPSEPRQHEPFLVSGSIGAAAGFGAACLLFRDRQQGERAENACHLARGVPQSAAGCRPAPSVAVSVTNAPEPGRRVRIPALAGPAPTRVGIRLDW